MKHFLNRSPMALILVSLFLVMLGSGCSSFNREWRAAAPIPPAGMEGRWLGTWRSDVNGHNGKLRCLVRRTEAGQFEARFHAKYKRILSFGYTVGLTVQEESGSWKFAGEADLGWMAGGAYQYEGQASTTNFLSAYRCASDHGLFQMTRPGPNE